MPSKFLLVVLLITLAGSFTSMSIALVSTQVFAIEDSLLTVRDEQAGSEDGEDDGEDEDEDEDDDEDDDEQSGS